MSLETHCFICEGTLELGCTSTVKRKGIVKFIENSRKRGDNKWTDIENLDDIIVHEKCRVAYAAQGNLKAGSGIPQERYPRRLSLGKAFNFEENCFLCGKPWLLRKTPGSVASNNIKQRFLEIGNARNDDWGKEVIRLIKNVTFTNVKARYHKNCYKSFNYYKSDKKIGRPKNASVETAFSIICQYLETHSDSQFTLSELLKVSCEYTPRPETLLKKLEDKYGDDVLILKRRGKDTIICFRDTQHDVSLQSWYKTNRSLNPAEEQINIVRAAAAIIRRDIRSKVYETSQYPSSHEFLNNVIDDVPETLRIFLEDVMVQGKSVKDDNQQVKEISIAHAIVSAVRPRSFVSSLQLSTGLYVHRKSGQKLIVELLSKQGLCSSYNKVEHYEASAIVNSKSVIDPDAFVQWVFDNADHNAATLDGLNTFHVMGGICCVTPGSALRTEGKIEKCKSMPTTRELAAQGSIDIIPYGVYNASGLKNVIFTDMFSTTLEKLPIFPVSFSTILWAKKCCNEINLPSWRGFMDKVTTTMHYEVSRVQCLPFINEPPTDLDTINTALHLASNECRRRSQKACFVTFDQSLYIKAREIVENQKEYDLNNVVVRLGGFHLLMSYLGAIGRIMGGSGIAELWSTVYAIISVNKMLDGHAFARAVRAHILTWTALGFLLIETAEVDNDIQEYLHQIIDNFEESPPTLEHLESNKILQGLRDNFIKNIDKVKDIGPTAKLWIQYFNCVTVVLQFIQAERLGNWTLHLQCVREMLPIFHAAAHFNYAKSAQIYLQDMINLEYIMDPIEFKKFTTGYFTVRRSDKMWAGNWTDMTIEQTLMRLISLGAGLLHGRGTSEGVSARYLLGMPIAFDVMDQLESFCNIRSESSEQHVELRSSRIERDQKDILTFFNWFNDHRPFEKRDHLISLASGLVAGNNVNCHEAVAKGLQGVESMIGKDAGTIKLTKTTSSVITLATTQNGVQIDGEHVIVNTTLLFQRISMVMQNDEQILKQALNYELAPYPLALFNEQGVMRKGTKSDLYSLFNTETIDQLPINNGIFVIDGGYFLHRVKWTAGKSYSDLCLLYVNFLERHFSADTVIVFDGYNSDTLGVKSYERYRRSSKKVEVEIKFTPGMICKQNQANFLSNTSNKARFIALLKDRLESAGFRTKQAEEDADVLIVKTAIGELSSGRKVIVVGTDIDLLALLIAHANSTDDIYFLKPKQSNKQKDLVFLPNKHQDLKDIILFAHAFSGCDTTSSLYYRDLALAFNSPSTTREIIIKNGEKLMLALYGAVDAISLSQLRYQRFVRSVATTQTEIRLAQLPPTSSAASQHVLRVYYQVQRWLNNDLNPEKWGWKRTETIFLPIMTDEPPAPQSLLKMIHCGCTGTCDKRCGCRKAGLKCSNLCKICQGSSCTNSQSFEIDLTDEPEKDEVEEIEDDIRFTNRFKTYNETDKSEDDDCD